MIRKLEPGRAGLGKSTRARAEEGYLLTEALVYIGLVFVILGIAYAIMYRVVDNSVTLRRNAEDIVRALDAGERWRTDVRSATRSVRWDSQEGEDVLCLLGPDRQVNYRFSGGAVFRRIGDGPWSRILDRVRLSLMDRDVRSDVTALRWELELQPQAKGSVKPGRIRPLFTFLAVPAKPARP